MQILNPRFNADLNAHAPIRLDLGSGGKRREGFFGVDHLPLDGVDILADLNQPLALIPDNSVDHLISSHVLEHVQNLLPLMQEIHRICKPDALIEITVPHFSNVYGFSDPTHVRFFGLYSMHYFVDPAKQTQPRKVPAFYTPTRFVIESIRLDFYHLDRIDTLFAGLISRLVNRSPGWQDFYERRLSTHFHARQICYRMRPDGKA
jgi:SAM-dependent methyltransferase